MGVNTIEEVSNIEKRGNERNEKEPERRDVKKRKGKVKWKKKGGGGGKHKGEKRKEIKREKMTEI